jgi:hypothetical protein
MIKYILLFLFFNCSTLYSQEFIGCGEYNFRGILREDQKAPLKMSYIVHESTKSELRFELVEKEDLLKLGVFVNTETMLKAKILNLMDGTKGELREISGISKRFPNPLVPNDTGIVRLQDIKCK